MTPPEFISPPKAPPAARTRLPELLAPAGDWECARAAVENGADAIYFGLNRFNARLRAQNFNESDLPSLMTWLHSRGVKGYVTFNTLVFARELEEAEKYLRTIIAAGVDAAIVQDIGVCRLIRRISPDFPIHASTQMTVTSSSGVEFVRELGCSVVVLARENSIPEIRRLRDELPPEAADTHLEIFIHGALCVAYSGQCLTSEALGGRSANRGECAQACRMPYDLVCDGNKVDLGDRRYLLSPQDLAGLESLPGVVDAGISSLKIEGRLKSPEYVASITRIYREALDRMAERTALETFPDVPAWGAPSPGHRPEEARYEMEMAFSRGLSPGWLHGIDNQRLVHARFGKKRGVYLGEIVRVGRDRIWFRAESRIAAGDGVVIDAGRPDQEEEGGRVFEVFVHEGLTAVTFLRGAVDFRKLQPGYRIWKTGDPQLERRLRQSYTGKTPQYQRSVDLEIHGIVGTPLVVIARDETGRVARAESAVPLSVAHQRPLDAGLLSQQLGRLGGTPYRLGRVTSHITEPLLVPVSDLNRIRREFVRQLDEQRSRPQRWSLHPEATAAPWIAPTSIPVTSDTRSAPPALVVLVRSLAQLEAAIRSCPEALYCEFEDPKRYREAVQLKESLVGAEVPLFVAPPRIFKPGEEWILKQIRSAGADGVLIRNHEHLRAFSDTRRIGDFSLNVANPISAEYLIRRWNLERVTASYDLNADQLEDLLRTSPPEWIEITLHQHMPMFHMEHCVYCAFLSSGKDYRDCGRPCDRHDVRLRDRVGANHPLRADAGCRNTVFNARAQTGADHASRFIAAGARRFRVEFLDESPDDVTRLIEQYRRLLRGEATGDSVWQEFRLIRQLGVTRGQMGRATGSDLGMDRWAESRPASPPN